MNRSMATRLIHAHPLPLAAGVAALHLLVVALAFDPVPHAGGDNTAYLTLARSILEHGRYLELWHPGAPVHTQYPPGFPLVLAGALSVGITSWAGLKALMAAFSVLAMGLAYLWMRERTEPAIALGAGVLLSLAPGIAAESLWVLSDVPFFAVTMAALLALERDRLRLGIALAFAALLIRAAGLPLLAALALWLLLRRRWRLALGVMAGVALLATLWTLWTLRSLGVEAQYVASFWLIDPYRPEAGTLGVLELGQRIVRNADRYAFFIFGRSLTGASGLVADITAAGILALAGVGLGRRLHLDGWRPGPVELFTAAYAAMLLLWPATWASDRFLLPLMPLLLVYAADGADALSQARARRILRVGGVALILTLAAVPLATLWSGAADCREAVARDGFTACLDPGETALIRLAQESRDVLPPGAIVISRKPRQWHYYSGAPSVVYPFSTDPDRLLEEARALGARYVVVDRLGVIARVYLSPVLARHSHRFCAVMRVDYRGSEAVLLGILPPDAEGAAVGSVQGDQVQFPWCAEGPDAYAYPSLSSSPGPR